MPSQDRTKELRYPADPNVMQQIKTMEEKKDTIDGIKNERQGYLGKFPCSYQPLPYVFLNVLPLLYNLQKHQMMRWELP